MSYHGQEWHAATRSGLLFNYNVGFIFVLVCTQIYNQTTTCSLQEHVLSKIDSFDVACYQGAHKSKSNFFDRLMELNWISNTFRFITVCETNNKQKYRLR